ncbi:hypothetical protein CC78DRAFT_45622 [Lojkania enalia]|uniref:DUF1772-domain-containing protein n=1 Tax=Lojkania enalia TaxID=147567 RepID=A0A9P4JZM4_9PLEO|nr:hypothetical protein CC78DRAFT_45622 [Didymosphaeria enalia]
MSDSVLVKTVAGTCISFSFILAGNAITQSWMTIPALLVDFPRPEAANHTERARLLGRQWPLCWSVGNQFFRPISTFGFVGYAYAAYSIYKEGDQARGDWRLLAVAAGLHLVTVLHSAMNMQPMNDKLEALSGRAGEKDMKAAQSVAERWGRWNLVRLFNPVVAGTLALITLSNLRNRRTL